MPSQQTADHLRGIAFFEGLPETLLWHLAKVAERRSLAIDELLIREGDPRAFFAVILDGNLAIERNDTADDGVPMRLATFGDGHVIAEGALLGSNTSTLPITELADGVQNADEFIGLHFFSPVDKMPLLEIIKGERTSEETLYRALDLAKQIKKTPIVVNDSRGFYTSRVFSTYVLEGLAMLAEGVAPALIENAGVQAGMPVGPLALIDEVSSELIHKVNQQTRADLGVAYIERPGEAVAERMVALGRIGRKAGQGFYDYPADGKKRLWPDLQKHFPADPKLLYGEGEDKRAKESEIKKRLLYVQAVDTARCLEANVLTDPADGDVGSIMGLGFAPQTGGAISLIDQVGVKKFVAECDEFARKYGKQFEVPKLLRDMAAKGQSFYGQHTAKAA